MSEQLIKTKIKILRHLKRKKITIISHYHNTTNIFVNSTFKPRSLAGTQHSGDFQKQNPGILSVCWVLNNVGNEMRRGGESRSGGNVLVTGVDTIPTEKDCLNPRTGSQESHYPDVRGGEAFVRGLC